MSKDGLERSRKAVSIRRSGRMRLDLGDEGLDRRGRTRVPASVSQGNQGRSSHQRCLRSCVVVRWCWVVATSLSLGREGSWCSCVDPALGLGGAGPAAAARVVAGRDASGARPAADAGVAVVDERVHQDAVVGDVGVDLLVAPAGQRGDLDLALAGVPADDRRDDAVVGLGATQSGGPGVVLRERVGERLDLAQRAAEVGVGLVEVLAVLRVLLGDGQRVPMVRRLTGSVASTASRVPMVSTKW